MSYSETLHKSELVSLLGDITRDGRLGPRLVFKGGTAAYLFYGLTRGSVDLDFDLLDAEAAGIVEASLREIVATHGTVRDKAKTDRGMYLELSYRGKPEGAPNIKIDVNFRDFGSRHEVLDFLGIPVNVMVREDMAAHKLVAMRERMGKANRDIYDVWFFLHNNWPINTDIVKRRSNLSYADFLDDCVAKLEKMKGGHILDGLGLYLTESQKSKVRANLISDTVFLLKARRVSIEP